MTVPGQEAKCPLCDRVASGDEIIHACASAVAFADAYPVSEGHVLVVPRRHLSRIEDLEADEWTELFRLVREVCRKLSERDGVDGVNVGVNSGVAAGQTVDHAHVHVIPRRLGDVPDPRGGVRHVIPGKADYWNYG
jgi:diadenosine tetraphosphate (Ap4A) HIT family hydrolase